MAARCVPMIHVPDVRATVEWYERIGFSVVETYSDGGKALSFAVMSFGSSQMMFNAGGRTSAERRRDVDLYVYTEHVDAIHERLRDLVDVVEGPHDTFYGMREVIVRDLNGFWVTFGELSSGELLMRGVRSGDAQAVGTALDRGGLASERLSAAVAAAMASDRRNDSIVRMLEEAGALPPPAITVEALQRHVGTYTKADGYSARVVLQEGVLRLFPDDSPAVNLLPIDQAVFRALELEGATVTFESTGRGVTGLTFRHGAYEMRLTRAD